MSKKIRKKKGNGITIANKTNKIFMRDTAILQLNAEPLHVLNLAKMAIDARPTNARKHAIMDSRHQWTVGLLLFTTESNGKKKMVMWQDTFSTWNNYEVLCEGLIETHREMLREYESKVTIESLGVISTPQYKFDLDQISDDIDRIFCEMGCYEKTINKMMES